LIKLRFTFLLAVGLLSWVVSAQGQTFRCTQSGQSRVCRIDQPDVKHSVTSYPAVTFKPGDRVVVQAAGCVQTGGHGKTWKRYVNPSGANSDRFYHGLIFIPGITLGEKLDRISTRINQTLVIPAGVAPPGNVLKLGYEDDGFGDNGYYAHDDGTENQCRNVGPAWVQLTITPSPVPPPQPSAPMDLVADNNQQDLNGLLFNPRWKFETTSPAGAHPDPNVLCDGFPYPAPGNPPVGMGHPPCISPNQGVNIDVGEGSNGTLCENFHTVAGKLHGHLNYRPVTYSGHVYFVKHDNPVQFNGLSVPSFGDDDYNMYLDTANHSGISAVNDDLLGVGKVIEIEYDSDETIDHFQSYWWNQWHSAVDANDGNSGGAASHMVDGGEAIVIGLMNIDAEHGPKSEIHPVYALAMHVENLPGDIAQDERWAIFVRNTGDEGFCSHLEHQLPLADISILIPHPGATGAQLIQPDFRANNGNVTMDTPHYENGGLLLTFHLGPPENGSMVDGSFTVRWTMSTARIAQAVAQPFGIKRVLAPNVKPETESHLPATALAPMNPQQQALLKQKLAKPAPVKNQFVVKQVTQTAVARSARSGPVTDVTKPNPRKADRDRKAIQALCEAYASNVPKALQNVCPK